MRFAVTSSRVTKLVIGWLCFFCVSLGALAAAERPATKRTDSSSEASVVVFNRPIAVLRSDFMGTSAAERARRTEDTISGLLDQGGPGEVTVQDAPQGSAILIDGALAMLLTPDDTDALRGENLSAATNATVARLKQVIAETKEIRDQGRMLRALAYVAVATVILVFIIWGLVRLRRWASARMARLVAKATNQVQVAGAPLMKMSSTVGFARSLITGAFWLLTLVALYEWLTYALTRFPYTRAWGEQLSKFLVGIVVQIGGSILKAMPDLLVAIIIFLMARALTRALSPIFDRIERGHTQGGWLDRDMAGPTRRLSSIAIWLFAVVMAYPYLPGADSEAFKGVSVLVGLMLTLGGSSLVGQAASGIILMYSRTLRVGEYVRIGDQEGTVHELGTFTTKIRTGMGEEVSVPNALVLSSVTKNYSRTVRGRGYIVDTVVTIGYDTPWRQVEAMLLEAASRTNGILEDPKPRVMQTGLSDFYIEYRLIGQAVPSEPRPRAEVLNTLHGHIVDVFNEHKVQIMSPHYLGDPAADKIVPRENWYTAPARPPQDTKPKG